MPRRPAKHVYHQDDRVVIVEPAVFDRVGYPLSKEAALAHVTQLIEKDLAAVFEKVGFTNGWGLIDTSDSDFDRALSAIAHAYMRSQGYGGRDRTIHTHIDERFRGKIGHVIRKRTVKTGRYAPGGQSYSIGGYEPDYDPPCLRNEQTHVILTLSVCLGQDPHDTAASSLPWDWEEIQIEERHVRPETPADAGLEQERFTAATITS